MKRHPAPHRTPLARIVFWTFVVVYVLAALFEHYIGLRNRVYSAFPTTTYEPLSWTNSCELALLIALIASIWVGIKWK
jgi:ABC-type sugar transport system permease subunit